MKYLVWVCLFGAGRHSTNVDNWVTKESRVVEEVISGSVAATERPKFWKLFQGKKAGDVLILMKRGRLNVCFWPILLKKSAMVSTAEKYRFEIEIFTLSRGFRARISHRSAQKRRFQQSVCGQFGRTDFFNTIGRLQAVMKSYCWPIAAGRRIRIRRTKDNMIRRHYEMWINEDGPDVVGLLQLALKLSPVTALL